MSPSVPCDLCPGVSVRGRGVHQNIPRSQQPRLTSHPPVRPPIRHAHATPHCTPPRPVRTRARRVTNRRGQNRAASPALPPTHNLTARPRSPLLPSPPPPSQRPCTRVIVRRSDQSIDEGALLRVRGGRGARGLLRRRSRAVRALRPRRARRQPPRRQAPPPAPPLRRLQPARRVRAKLRHMPGGPRLLLLRGGPRAALPELRRRRAHRQRLRLRAPEVPAHRRPGRPRARRTRRTSAGAGAGAATAQQRLVGSPATADVPQEEEPDAALQRWRHRLGGRRGRRHHGELARLVCHRRAVRQRCHGVEARGAGDNQSPSEEEPPGGRHGGERGTFWREHAGLAAGRVLRLHRVQLRLRIRRKWHVQGRQREAQLAEPPFHVVVILRKRHAERAGVLRPGAGGPVVEVDHAGAPLPAHGLRHPLAGRPALRLCIRHRGRVRAGHLLPGEPLPVLHGQRRSAAQAPAAMLTWKQRRRSPSIDQVVPELDCRSCAWKLKLACRRED